MLQSDLNIHLHCTSRSSLQILWKSTQRFFRFREPKIFYQILKKPLSNEQFWILKLEALRERRPPWPRQIITLILPTVKMLSLGCERLPPPPPTPKKKKVLDHYLHHDLGRLPLLWWFFAHLPILQYPDHHKNLISTSLYYSGPLHKISFQSVHNCLSNVVHRQTNRQTNQLYQKHNLLCQGPRK